MGKARRRRWRPAAWTSALAPGQPSWPPCVAGARSGLWMPGRVRRGSRRVVRARRVAGRSIAGASRPPPGLCTSAHQGGGRDHETSQGVPTTQGHGEGSKGRGGGRGQPAGARAGVKCPRPPASAAVKVTIRRGRVREPARFSRCGAALPAPRRAPTRPRLRIPSSMNRPCCGRTGRRCRRCWGCPP